MDDIISAIEINKIAQDKSEKILEECKIIFSKTKDKCRKVFSKYIMPIIIETANDGQFYLYISRNNIVTYCKDPIDDIGDVNNLWGYIDAIAEIAEEYGYASNIGDCGITINWTSPKVAG